MKPCEYFLQHDSCFYIVFYLCAVLSLLCLCRVSEMTLTSSSLHLVSDQLIHWSAIIKPNTWQLLTHFVKIFCLYMTKKNIKGPPFYIFAVYTHPFISSHRIEISHFNVACLVFLVPSALSHRGGKKKFRCSFPGLFCCVCNKLPSLSHAGVHTGEEW